MQRFILATALAFLGGTAQAQSYYYDTATNTYYQYPALVQAGNVVVSPGYVSTASYYTPAPTYYYPSRSYYYSVPYSRSYYTDYSYVPAYNSGYYNYNRGYRGWRR